LAICKAVQFGAGLGRFRDLSRLARRSTPHRPPSLYSLVEFEPPPFEACSTQTAVRTVEVSFLPSAFWTRTARRVLYPIIPPIRTLCYNSKLRCQYNGSAYPQQMLGDQRLVEARNLFKNLFLKSNVSINPHDLEIIKEALILCFLHSQKRI
jgi:hypothetical protein